MPWVYLDDGFPDHPKTAAAGGDAAWLFVCILAYCRRFLTGGKVPKDQIPRLSDRKRPLDLATKLQKVGYLEDMGDHYFVHDYDAWNASEEGQRQARQEKARKAADARWRKERRGRPPDARSNAQASVEHELEQCSTDAIPHPQPQTHSVSSLSELRPVGDRPAEMEDSRTGPAERLTARAVDSLPALNGSVRPKTWSVMTWVTGYLDERVADEILGYCLALDVPPRTPQFLATTFRQHAAQRGVDMPPWSNS